MLDTTSVCHVMLDTTSVCHVMLDTTNVSYAMLDTTNVCHVIALWCQSGRMSNVMCQPVNIATYILITIVNCSFSWTSSTSWMGIQLTARMGNPLNLFVKNLKAEEQDTRNNRTKMNQNNLYLYFYCVTFLSLTSAWPFSPKYTLLDLCLTKISWSRRIIRH